MLEAVDITKTWPGADKPAVDHVSLTIGSGEFVSILGRSGSGKSTLLHVLSSLILPDSGRLLFEGRDISAASARERDELRGKSFAVVFQQHHLIPYLSSLENVLLPFMGGMASVSAADRAAAKDMLARVGLERKMNDRPGRLSGGEQQRVAIARALVRGARILFADEPTGSLDSATGDEIMELLHGIHKSGTTIAMVTHNPEYARRTSRIVTMSDGKIVAE